MGRNNKRRRAAKKRERDRRHQQHGPSGGAPSGGVRFGDAGPFRDAGPFGEDGLVGDGDLLGGYGADDDWLDGEPGGDEPGNLADIPSLLMGAASRPGSAQAEDAVDLLLSIGTVATVGAAATDVLVGALATLYEHGWQPADLMHVSGKKLASAGAPLIAGIIEWDADQRRADRRAPCEWRAQLADIEAQFGPPAGDSALIWQVAAGRGIRGGLHDIVGALGMLITLPPLDMLTDPPSRWPRERASSGGSGPAGRADPRRPAGAGRTGVARTPAGEHDPKMLARIRALLAKAESTEFPEEAEALSGKAQDLMSRYAIDEALVSEGRAPGSEIRARRVHIDSPYAATKVQLLAAVGAANRVRVIWLDKLDMATAVGFPLDLDLAEMLYTSLLVQATRAMTDAGRSAPGARTVSYRRAFLLAYAQRIGERLVRADAEATADAAARSSSAEMVLARRSREVDEEFARLFPQTRRMRTRRVNAHGWYAGREAADRATIAGGRLDAGGRPS